MPILEVVLRQLAKCGFNHVTLAVNHMANIIQAFFGDGSRWGIKIDYSLEEKPLSTIGPLTLIDDLPENFIVMNGDVLCDLDYGRFLRYHEKRGNDITVSSYDRDVKIDFGVLKYDKHNNLTEFFEKPVYHFDISMGVYCISRRVIKSLKVGQPYGFDNLMLDSLKKKRSVEIKPFHGFWLDIGRPEDFDSANQGYENIKKMLRL
jgi:NDP-sugar pyrophosphorylase family protein